MPRKLPPVKGSDAIAAFGRVGYCLDRICGSHHILKHPDKVNHLSIPVHGARPVGEGLLKRQIKLAGMTIEEFADLL
jgi:predicted RNA binding protein YcfA (HicA-like mRNA interferase family)